MDKLTEKFYFVFVADIIIFTSQLQKKEMEKIGEIEKVGDSDNKHEEQISNFKKGHKTGNTIYISRKANIEKSIIQGS